MSVVKRTKVIRHINIVLVNIPFSESSGQDTWMYTNDGLTKLCIVWEFKEFHIQMSLSLHKILDKVVYDKGLRLKSLRSLTEI